MYVLLACYQWGSQDWRLLASRGTSSLAPQIGPKGPFISVSYHHFQGSLNL